MAITPESIIQDMQNNANAAFGIMEGSAQRAESAAQSFTDLPEAESVSVEPLDLQYTDDDFHEFDGTIDIRSLRAPVLRDFEDVYLPNADLLSDIGDGEPATLDTTGLFDAVKVTGPRNFDKQAPSVETSYTLPTAPTLRDVNSPALSAYNTVSVSNVTLPNFASTQPGARPVAPTDIDATYKAQYNQFTPDLQAQVDAWADQFIADNYPTLADQRDSLNTKITSFMSGQSALPDDVEQAMFNRERDRIEAEDIASADEIEFGGSQYGMPQPFIQNQHRRRRQVAHDRIAREATESQIRKHEREQTNMQFAMQLLNTIRESATNAAIAYYGTMLQLAGTGIQHSANVVNFLLQGFQAASAQWSLELQFYQAQAAVYETELKASLSQYEKARILLEIEQNKANVDNTRMQAVNQQLQVERQKIELYTAQLQGVETRIRANGMVLDQFAQEVNAYRAEVDGTIAGIQAYEASIRGDAELVRSKTAEYENYRSLVQARRELFEAEKSKADNIRDHNRNLVELYRAELDPYIKQLDIREKEADFGLREYLALLDKYKTDLDKENQNNRIKLEKARLSLEADTTNAANNIRTALAQAEIFSERRKVLVSSMQNLASVSGNVAAGAMSALNGFVGTLTQTINDA